MSTCVYVWKLKKFGTSNICTSFCMTFVISFMSHTWQCKNKVVEDTLEYLLIVSFEILRRYCKKTLLTLTYKFIIVFLTLYIRKIIEKEDSVGLQYTS